MMQVLRMYTYIETQTMLSPVMLFGPTSLPLSKPVVLSFQHCADVRQGQWSLAVCSADAYSSELAHWKVVTLCYVAIDHVVLSSWT